MDSVVVPSTANPIRDRIRQEFYRLLKAVGSGGKSLWLQFLVIVLFCVWRNYLRGSCFSCEFLTLLWIDPLDLALEVETELHRAFQDEAYKTQARLDEFWSSCVHSSGQVVFRSLLFCLSSSGNPELAADLLDGVVLAADFVKMNSRVRA
jgi:hypothetical protein